MKNQSNRSSAQKRCKIKPREGTVLNSKSPEAGDVGINVGASANFIFELRLGSKNKNFENKDF